MLEYLTLAAKLLPVVISTGGDIYAFLKPVYDIAKHKREPTDAEWATLNAHEADLEAIVNAPFRDNA